MSLEYGMIGNGRTIALVSDEASIDWFCMPRFDSPSIFAKLLDKSKGGEFRVDPEHECKRSQEYVDDTNVLKTTFSDEDAEIELYDYFPYYEDKEGVKRASEIQRFVVPKKGSMKLKFGINPKFNYATGIPKVSIEGDRIAYKTEKEILYVYSNMDLSKIVEGKYIDIDKESYIALTYNMIKPGQSVNDIKADMKKTQEHWKKWASNIKAPDQFRKHVIRSALTLRMLTYDDSGAIVAAPTTSLPEIIGDVRNWDYRYCWIRDASFTVLALLRIGKSDVAHEFITWLNKIFSESGAMQQPLFGINGERELKERTLDYLEGYMGSRPVRVGNAAYLHRQQDIFGELLDAIHFFYVDYRVRDLSNEQWGVVYSSAESAINSWKNKDSSIWEFRNMQEHFTFSKVMSWVAVDRAVKIAKHFKKYDAATRWSGVARQIKRDVVKNGWNEKMKSFVQYYGSDTLDASLLLMPFFGFIEYDHPKMKATIDAIKAGLLKNGFVIRYSAKDDFGMPKNALIACTFWLIEALYEIGEKEEAVKLFNNIISHSNHLGLLSEDIDPYSGELVGNFPQAYSHIALINTSTILGGFGRTGKRGRKRSPA